MPKGWTENVDVGFLVNKAGAEQETKAKVSFVIAILFLAIFFSTTTNGASAQNIPPQLFRNELEFSPPKVSFKAPQKKKLSKKSRKAPRHKSIGDINEDLQLDTAEEVLEESRFGAEFLPLYQGVTYLKYFNDSIDFPDFEEDSSRSAAEKLLVFNCVKTISEFLRQSPLQDFYLDIIDGVRKYRRYTHVQVGQHASGALTVAQNENSLQGKELFKFKIHTSIHHGIEPRLLFGDNLVLKYDTVREAPLFQYEFGF